MAKISRRSTMFLAAGAGLGVGLAGATALPAHAAYYNEYTTVALNPSIYDCSIAEGFAAGATYLYLAKIRSDEGRSVIYRTNKDTGSTEVMTNGTDNTKYNSWLGHANDMSIADIDGQHHLFVVTLQSSGAQLIKLRYDGATYYKAGSYAVQLGGVAKAVSGITRLAQDSTAITWLFKAGSTVYKGTLPLRANSGTIAITKAFDLKTDGALVNGSPVADIGDFVNQGVFLDATHHDLYYPLTNKNRSIVLVYRNVTASSTGTLTSDPNLSFRITSAVYPTNFEIESVGISDGRLYFGTNRSKSSSDANYDAVHYFNGYTVG